MSEPIVRHHSVQSKYDPPQKDHSHYVAKLDSIVEAVMEAVEEVLNATRCPKCNHRGLQVVSLVKPIGPTGIFECSNTACPVGAFDPACPEVPE